MPLTAVEELSLAFVEIHVEYFNGLLKE